jgi:type IV pilus assembly protein PilN
MKLTLNLASRSYLNRRALYFVYLVLAALLLLLLGAGMYSYLRSHQRVGQLNARLAELEGAHKAGEESVKAVLTGPEQESLVADIKFANEILNMDGFRWTRLLDRLEAVLPEQVGIQAINPEYKEGSFSLTGHARDVEDLRNLLDNMSASPDFSDVYLLQQSREETPEGETLLSFSLVVKGAF